MNVRRGRVLGRVLLGLWAGSWLAASGCAGDGATRDASADAIVANPFEGADNLSCMQLDQLWHQQQDLVAASLRVCQQDADCVVVSTALNCTPITGQDIEVAGCDTAVAATSESVWTQHTAALAAQLCAVRTLECVSSSLCPQQLIARCVSDLCQAQSPQEAGR